MNHTKLTDDKRFIFGLVFAAMILVVSKTQAAKPNCPPSRIRKSPKCGGRRNAAAIGLINLICNLARYEQIVRLKLLSRTAT